MNPLIRIEHLSICHGQHNLVDDVSLHVDAGEWLALVGESGSGKSLTALACLGLLPPSLRSDGVVHVAGTHLSQASASTLRALRGGRVGMIYQEPLSALNPLQRIGQQLIEAVTLHKSIDRALARQQVIRLLREVGIDEPERRLRAWPHELSGGQRQRVVIAMALVNSPTVLIADEPTTALDALLQSQILDLLKSLQKSRQLSILFISHNLPQVRRYADRVMVMQAGRVIESAATEVIFSAPQQAYTQKLLQPFASPIKPTLNDSASTVLSISQLLVRYPRKQAWWGGITAWHEAVKGVGLTLRAGESLGIVGESGSGKSSLAAALLRLTPAQGRVVVLGRDWLALQGRDLRQARAQLQIVFQDPYGSLSPRLTVADIVAEGLLAHASLSAAALDTAVVTALQAVSLDPDTRHRYPHEFSGGQRQRIALARAIILKPAILILDEPTSALDRHTQGEVVELLRRIQAEQGIAMLFISHDLAVVRALCHRLIVLREGRIIEQGDCERIFQAPQHSYTKALVADLPREQPTQQRA
ncbi:microcin C transport system ATP-binding protein [Paraperlucidibaca baekdonensis]|uniref:Microcin C transport system ATP-binding protein n=2 Tax=Paraperlucidibaca baekdonensis TaxID=748120 RepID=A0A3E0H359_9GAMM|nr:microcin C transport system ATP-binding protein [Paraperlucidibaca baekdonensis]